eukprot:TRINITY_DN6089_c0_g1_i1.p1 TRINITY_DN6089_c0_g1~~TRINITY_DN6089_c0_g1_i1.p1  ORF type:complete len:367 (-),score=88.43 TRINITY_DN6089_c0_g1_i1:760-1860(-)
MARRLLLAALRNGAASVVSVAEHLRPAIRHVDAAPAVVLPPAPAGTMSATAVSPPAAAAGWVAAAIDWRAIFVWRSPTGAPPSAGRVDVAATGRNWYTSAAAAAASAAPSSSRLWPSPIHVGAGVHPLLSPTATGPWLAVVGASAVPQAPPADDTISSTSSAGAAPAIADWAEAAAALPPTPPCAAVMVAVMAAVAAPAAGETVPSNALGRLTRPTTRAAAPPRKRPRDSDGVTLAATDELPPRQRQRVAGPTIPPRLPWLPPAAATAAAMGPRASPWAPPRRFLQRHRNLRVRLAAPVGFLPTTSFRIGAIEGELPCSRRAAVQAWVTRHAPGGVGRLETPPRPPASGGWGQTHRWRRRRRRRTH